MNSECAQRPDWATGGSSLLEAHGREETAAGRLPQLLRIYLLFRREVGVCKFVSSSTPTVKTWVLFICVLNTSTSVFTKL